MRLPTILGGKRGEVAWATLLLLATAVGFAETFRFREVPWDSLGMAFWPRVLLAALAFTLVLRLWQLRGEVFESQPGFARGIAVLGLCLLFVLGTLAFGILITVPFYLLAFALLCESEDRRKSILFALAAAMVVIALAWFGFNLGLGLRVMVLPSWMR